MKYRLYHFDYFFNKHLLPDNLESRNWNTMDFDPNTAYLLLTSEQAIELKLKSPSVRLIPDQ